MQLIERVHRAGINCMSTLKKLKIIQYLFVRHFKSLYNSILFVLFHTCDEFMMVLKCGKQMSSDDQWRELSLIANLLKIIILKRNVFSPLLYKSYIFSLNILNTNYTLNVYCVAFLFAQFLWHIVDCIYIVTCSCCFVFIATLFLGRAVISAIKFNTCC